VIPGNLDHTVFDEVHWVTAAEAYTATRLLHRQTSLFCGGTSGAAWLVARGWAAKNPKARVVCIFPDDGYRYTDTIYNDEYLCKENLWAPELPEVPDEVTVPMDAHSCWSYIQWERREYSEVVKAELHVDL
jgi:cysteine synthase A